jgi:hypothetical protein
MQNVSHTTLKRWHWPKTGIIAFPPWRNGSAEGIRNLTARIWSGRAWPEVPNFD